MRHRVAPKRWNIPIIGGDTKLGQALAILGVAIGSAKSNRNLFLKNAAEPDDLVWASGDLGSCCAAVLGMKRGDMNKNWQSWAESTLKIPNVPMQKSRNISEIEIGRGGIDISDGLGSDLNKLCDASDVGIIVDAVKIPISSSAKILAKKEGIPPWTLSFGIGGDFQFVVTTSIESKPIMESLEFKLIGEITSNKKRYLRLPDNRNISLPKLGHSDFQSSSFYEEAKTLINNLVRGI